MTSCLIDSLSTTDALNEQFSDRVVLESLIAFEVALARAQARLGLIPDRAAEVIAAAGSADCFDPATIARASRQSATISIPFVKAFTARVSAIDASSAAFVHWGATSQDVADTAFILILKQVHAQLGAAHAKLIATVRDLSERHAETPMLGRTLMQPALPITFGLKTAGWFGALTRAWSTVEDAMQRGLVLQLGGASGTLAAFGPHGLVLTDLVARDLGLSNPDAPWHAHRDRLAGVATSHGVYTAVLGKMARDISLLMQHEVGEAFEPGGGSSTMPHKRNPAGCAVALAAATRTPGLVASFLAGMVQEHERAVGGWQAEWSTLAALLQATGSALGAMLGVAQGLRVSEERMRANMDATHGLIFAEKLVMLTTPRLGRDVATDLAREAVEQSHATGRSFREAVAAMPEFRRVLSDEELHGLDQPEQYLGVAEALRQQLLAGSHVRARD